MAGGSAFGAVIVDYGGVLTSPVRDTMRAFCGEADIDSTTFGRVLGEWLSAEQGSPLQRLERGEIGVAEFEDALAARLTTRAGERVGAPGLLTRMFAASAELPELVMALHQVKASGRRIGLLSNSWGNTYPTELWGGLFDDMVLSGDVGLRKPQGEIYELAASRLGVCPAETVFVDDVRANVDGAVAVGMTGILHATAEETIREREVLLDLPLV